MIIVRENMRVDGEYFLENFPNLNIQIFHSIRWFSYCSHGNLNGRYNSGVTWYDLSNNEWMAVKTTLMMLTKREECLNTNSIAENAAYISSIEISDSNPSTKVSSTIV